MHLKPLDFAVLVAYLIGLFLVGVYFSRRQTSKEVYFLAGRRMPWLLAGVSVIATLLSTISYLAIPGEMIGYGVGFFASLFAFVLIIPIVNWVIIPALMRLPVTSVYDYLEKRFSIEARVLGAGVFVAMRLVWIGLIMYTASRAISAMTGWSVPAIVLVMGLVTTVYTTMGGMIAVIWTDFVQFVLLFGGAVFIPIYVAFRTGTGPLGWWGVFSQAGRSEVPVFSLDPTVRISMVGMVLVTLLWNICTHGADQVAAQRYLTTPSASTARRSMWVFSLCNVGIMFLLMLCGLALFFFNFSESVLPLQQFQDTVADKADDVLPRFIATELPSGVSGLLLAALLAAAMSSLSSGINSISTVAMTDFFQRFGILRRHQEGVALAMILAFAAGIVGVGAALAVYGVMQVVDWNLLELIERVNHLFLAPLGALFLVGILFRRVGSTAALLGFGLGVLASFLISFSQEVFALEERISFMWIMPAAFVVSLITSYAAGFLFEAPSEAQLAALYQGSGGAPDTPPALAPDPSGDP